LRALVFTIENRALRPGASLYLVTTPAGLAIAGNVGSLAPGVMSVQGWSETAYRRMEDTDNVDHRALVNVTQLSGGFRLLIGRDLEERRRLFGIVAQAAQWSILVVVVLGIGGGIFVVPLDWTIRAYFAMGMAMLVQSSFILAKTIRDLHETNRMINRIEEARTEKLLGAERT